MFLFWPLPILCPDVGYHFCLQLSAHLLASGILLPKAGSELGQEVELELSVNMCGVLDSCHTLVMFI